MQESSSEKLHIEQIEYLRQFLIGKHIFDIIKSDINRTNNLLDIEKKLSNRFQMLLGEGLHFKLFSYNKVKDKVIVNEDFYLDDYFINLSNEKLINDLYISTEFRKTIFLFYSASESLSKRNITIDYLSVIEPTKLDFYIFQNDYDYIIDILNNNNIHKINNEETMYLGVNLVLGEKQPELFNSANKAKLFIKREFLSYYLNNFFVSNYYLQEKNNIEDKKTNFDEYIQESITDYVGLSDLELCNLFKIKYDNRKSQWIELVYNMLKLKSNRDKEIIGKSSSIRTVRIEENGKIRESMPLSPIKLKDIALEQWEDSLLYKYFSHTKFLFFIFAKKLDKYVFKGVQFWKMNNSDLNTIVYSGWKNIKNIIQAGIKFDLIPQKSGFIVKNNLPAKNDNAIIHMRPHAKKACYRLKNGYVVGDKNDGDELPDGQYITKQSFWINNSYILSIIDNKFLK